MTIDHEAVFVIYLGVTGALFIALTAPRTLGMWSSAAAIPAGILLSALAFGVANVAVWFFHVSVRVPVGMSLAPLLVIILGVYRMGWPSYARVVQRHLLWASAPVVLLIVLRLMWDPAFILGDTIIQALHAQYILKSSHLYEFFPQRLSNWAYSYFVVCILLNYFNIMHFSYTPHLALIATIWSYYMVARNNVALGIAARVLSFVMMCSVSMIAPYYIISISFIGSNVFLLIFVTMLTAIIISDELSTKDRDDPYFEGRYVLIAILLLGIALSRVEGVVYSSFFILALFISGIYDDRKLSKAVAGQCFVVIMVKLYSIYYLIGVDGGMVSPVQVILLTSAYAMWLPYTFVFRYKVVRWISEAVLPLVVGIGSVSVVVLGASHEEFGTSISALSSNLFMEGLWGVVPYSFLVALVVAMLAGRRKSIVLAVQSLAAIVIFVIFVSLGRSPYYVDIADSGHRLLGAFIPMTAIILAALVYDLITPLPPQRPLAPHVPDAEGGSVSPGRSWIGSA